MNSEDVIPRFTPLHLVSNPVKDKQLLGIGKDSQGSYTVQLIDGEPVQVYENNPEERKPSPEWVDVPDGSVCGGGFEVEATTGRLRFFRFVRKLGKLIKRFHD